MSSPFWDERYATDDYIFGTAPNVFLASQAGLIRPGMHALAIADGTHPVKAWREHKGLTLQALADAAGVSKPYVSQIEGGKRAGTAATLRKLATALGVPPGALLIERPVISRPANR